MFLFLTRRLQGFCRLIGGPLAALLSLVLVAPMVFSQTLDEYEVKAAFLYNFTKFVEWNNVPTTEVFNICIFGDDPFGGSLDRLVKGKTAYNRKIQIRRIKEASEGRQCQIVFVRREEDAKAAKLIEAVRGMPVLTVSEYHKFVTMGGIIFFSTKEGRVSIGINSQPAESAGLKISAKLLSISKIGKDESEEP
jgi:uncharacterized protein DUF4154